MGHLRITSGLFSKARCHLLQPPSHFSRISLLHKFLTTISFTYRNSQMGIGIIAAEINQRLTNLNNFTPFSDFFSYFLPLKLLLSPICKQRHNFQVMENKLSSSLWKKSKFFRLLDRHHFSQLRIRLLLSSTAMPTEAYN